MLERYFEASRGTYDLFRPWLPHISLVIVIGHIGFSSLNVVQNQTESFWLRGFAIFVMLPYVFCHLLERFSGTSFLRNLFLLAIFATGPLFLLAGLFNELKEPLPDIVVVIRREFEFLASFGIFILASIDLIVALWIGFVLSTLVFLIAALLIPISWETLQPTWITLMSGYIIIYVALVLIARRKTDQAASRSELSEAIGSSIAHELRTPLLSIKTKATALDEIVPDLLANHGSEIVPNPRRRYLLSRASTSIVEEADSATTLIDIFLMNVKGPRTGSVNKEVFSLNEALQEALQRYPYRSEHERNAVSCENLPSTPIRGPRILLVHIVFNLLKNSFEQLGSTISPTVKISARAASDTVTLRFTDNGPGIKQKDLARIFEPFYTSTKFGTGVGLAFCKAAIESQFSGSINCESIPGRSTTMILEFPIDTHPGSKN